MPSETPRDPKRYRRANCLLSYWRDGRFVIENYLLATQIQCHPLLQTWLHELASDYSMVELHRTAGARGVPKHVVKEFLAAGILLLIKSPHETKDRAVAGWAWGHNARYFHFSTQEVAYTFDHEAIRSHFEKKAVTDPPPSPFKEYAAETCLLPPPVTLKRDFLDVLTSRRTCREFERRSINIDQLSTMLKWTFGKQRYYNNSRLDRRIIRTSPSGGARHPIEAYAVIQSVRNLQSGIYHYSVEHHGLTLLRKGKVPKLGERLFGGQMWVEDAAIVVFLTAVLPRSMWKYDHSRAYRVVLLDAGHIGQTFHLVSTALGLGVFTTAALCDRAVESELGIDGVDEVIVYAGAAGPAKRDSGNANP